MSSVCNSMSSVCNSMSCVGSNTSIALKGVAGGLKGRGALIVLEGLDRCGKSSQSANLTSFLESNGVPVEALRFPDRTTAIGQMISSYLSGDKDIDDRAVHLLFSANRWENRGLIEARLRAGVTVVVDRYSYSGVAFTAAKGYDLEWCKQPERGLPAPDLVFYLDISAEEAAMRGNYGEERYEKLDFQQRVAKQYQLLRDATWMDVDAMKSVEDIQEVIREEALKIIQLCRGGRRLWPLWQS